MKKIILGTILSLAIVGIAYACVAPTPEPTPEPIVIIKAEGGMNPCQIEGTCPCFGLVGKFQTACFEQNANQDEINILSARVVELIKVIEVLQAKILALIR